MLAAVHHHLIRQQTRMKVAAAAAGANAENTPAPTIEARPMTTAEVVPSRRTRGAAAELTRGC